MKAARPPINGCHLVRFGTAADQQFLLGKFLPTYDHLIINANILAYMTSALATFLSTKTKNKPYFVDPQTHAFQHDIKYIQSDSKKSKGKIKRSVQKLVEAFGDPVSSSISRGCPVTPANFRTMSLTASFCNRVLKFQEETVSKEISQSDAADYYKFVGLKASKAFSPSLLVAPYFYLSSSDFKRWLLLNIKCAEISIDLAKRYKKPLGVQIVISQDLLMNGAKMKVLIREYSARKPDLFLIWIDSFPEPEASEESLERFVWFINELGKTAPVVNLYGGFLSVALSRCGIANQLIGVAHSLEYGESRGVIPVGGGFPTAKYYFPDLHVRLLFRDALRAVRAVDGVRSPKKFYDNVCDCKQCRTTITKNPEKEFEEYGKMGQKNGGKPYPLPDTKKKTVAHYMWCKQKEYQLPMTATKVAQELTSIAGKLKTVRSVDTSLCWVWAEILNNKKS